MPQNDNPTSGNPYVKAFHDLMSTSKDFMGFLGDPGERQGIRQGFTDAVNRGAVAATLGAPVDMANMGLNLGKAAVGYLGNKAGVLTADQMPQLIDNPVGGSEYIGNQLQRFGMVSPNRNALAEGLAGVLPTSPTKSAKAVAAIAGGGVVPGMDLAATVFHGSPHKFDRFDSSKIGTGEGAQAYGHGLYLADSPEVARTYSADRAYVGASMQGKPQAINYDDPAWIAQTTIDELGDPSKAVARLQMVARTASKNMSPESAAGVQGAIDLILSGSVGAKGSLYKVDLPDEAIAKMLDYNKPINQQSSYVKDALERAGINSESSALAGPMAAGQETRLQKFGISGLRYQEGGSRSSNYVVFPGNENMLRILERNGQVLK